jgi:hypothetical protein
VERISFKISVKLGKSASAACAVLLEAHVEAVNKSSGTNSSKNSFERSCKMAREAFVQKCANPTNMLLSAESRSFRHSAQAIHVEILTA